MSTPKNDYRSPLYQRYVQEHTNLEQETTVVFLENQRKIYKKFLRRFFPQSKSAHVLDLGCGNGWFMYLMQKEGYENVIGIDCSAEQVELGTRLGVRGIQQGDLFEFFEKNSRQFDLIVAFDLLEHLKKEETLEFLRQVFKVLKPGGRFLFRVPNGASPFSGYYRYADFTHEIAYTKSSVQQVLLSVGFEKIEVFPAEPISHGLISFGRSLVWKAITLLLKLYLVTETGVFSDHVLTQNLFATAKKPQ